MRALVLFVLFVCGDVRCMLCCGFFLRLVCPVLPVSLDCPFLIVPSVFSDVYLIKVHVIVMLVDGIDLILITVTREQTHRAAQRFPICRIGSSLAKEWGWQIMVRKVGPCIIVGYVSIGIIICGFTFHGIDILDFRFELQSFIHSIK
jgi:hypothetical protein